MVEKVEINISFDPDQLRKTAEQKRAEFFARKPRKKGVISTSKEIASTPFSILGILSSASNQEAEKAFRKIALTCHPDKIGDDITPENREKLIQKFLESQIALNSILERK